MGGSLFGKSHYKGEQIQTVVEYRSTGKFGSNKNNEGYKLSIETIINNDKVAELSNANTNKQEQIPI